MEVSCSDDGWRLDDDTNESLRTAIESADLIVFVITEQHSMKSPKALFEWGAVVAAKKQLLPLLVLKEGEQRTLPFRWSGRLAMQVDSPQNAAGQVTEYASKLLAAA